MKITVKLNNPKGTFDRIFNDNVMLYANTRVHALCSPYVPMDSGALDQTVNITKGYVEYKVPYARKMYYGQGLNFSKDKHPLATAKWDKAMITAKGAQLAREIEKYAKR